ncbi:nuclear transport factor 2 family protein [uncultured Ramlibacter sp.]|uniref:nuclear transport factor 2 family protein n=1 Tax=uncultured Ramlibacter sp. TaxID=260755 RepID=UPI00262D20BD|nr:nuclear transport factor 2 family protein [uncultured Ramlibacter sp.]
MSAADEVAAAAEHLRRTMLKPDAATLDALFADDLSYGHSNARVETKADFIGDLLSGASAWLSIDIDAQTIRVTQDTALLRHLLTADTNDGGKPGHVVLHILQVWQRQGGQWRLLARQAVRPPV